MKTAYIYVRVSTDEQMRRGYSLIEQEQRLLQYCSTSNIQVEGIFREDYSAKDFNRPEWKKLIKTIKKNKNRPSGNILFLKWDRFSRNIQYAYQMLSILGDLNIQAMAIDQPIDFGVPESIVMLAIYLSIPEAENSRRGKNTSDGMRRAVKLGRWPSKAPIGYTKKVDFDGKKIIVPKQPEADHIRWAFQQMATGAYSIRRVNKMANLNGFACRRNNFWRLMHNPIYCGFVTLSASKDEPMQLIRGIHEPLISEDLFRDVQDLIHSRRRDRGNKESLKRVFPLRGFLICPYCGRRLSGSFSQGRYAKYRYYHCCTPRCRGRYRSDLLEADYEEHLKNIWIVPAAYKLFKLILEDENIFTAQKALIRDRKVILNEIEKEEAFMTKARKLFVEDHIDREDFASLKKEQRERRAFLAERLDEIGEKIKANEINSKNELVYTDSNILSSYKNLDIEGKRYIINLFRPSSINIATKKLNALEIAPEIMSIILRRKDAGVASQTISAFHSSN